MSRPLSPAQRANQVTFVLKGHLKNAQIAYLRVAALLAKVRDERLYAALKFSSLEQYAVARLGLQRASLYRYLQIYDWVRKYHPAWLARKVKGFIPEMTDAYALMWIDHHLEDPHLSDEMRRTLELLREKALAGKLSHDEFQEVQAQGRTDTVPLRAVLSALRVARRRAVAVRPSQPDLIRDLDAFIERVIRMLQTTQRVSSLAGLRRPIVRLAAPSERRGRSRAGRRFGQSSRASSSKV
jgi:hypothetical protein